MKQSSTGKNSPSRLLRSLIGLTALFLSGSLSVSAKELIFSAQKTHKQIAPSVALIKDIDSHGSGVILTRAGLLITNYHVVASGLPLDITVKVKKNGKIINQTFKNQTIWKVHPKYDLALIKLPSKGLQFAAAKTISPNHNIASGATCFAIGNPAGTHGALEQSITQGLISSPNRVINKLKYLQVSCALNPGNSGGAICDNKGNVIGIATWKLGQAENIGFAIPFQNIKIQDFVLKKERKENPQLAIKYENEGHRYANLSNQLQGEDREIAIYLATTFYRKSMEYIPNKPSPYNNIGIMYFRLKKDEYARKYLERALELRPLYSNAASSLGIILARSYNDEAGAIKLWFKHTADTESLAGASDCAENLAISYFNKKQYAETAYCIKWANALHAPSPQRKETRTKIWETSSQQLSEAQFHYLKNKKTKFSKTDLLNFAAGKIPTTAKSAVNTPTKNNSLSSLITPVSGKKYFKIASEKSKSAVTPGIDGIAKPLPAKPDKVILGYAGCYLIMHFPDLKRIGVFDLCETKFTKYIPLAEDEINFAAGGQLLLIHYPKSNKFEFWNMQTWKKRNTKIFRSERKIGNMAMGLLNHNFAAVILPEGNAHKNERVGLLSLPDCTLTIPKWIQLKEGIPMVHFSASVEKDCRIFVEDSGKAALAGNHGRCFMNLANINQPEVVYFHTGSGQSSGISTGGDYVVSANRVYEKYGSDRILYQRLMKEDPENTSTHRLVSHIHGYKGVLELSQYKKEDPSLKVRAFPLLNVIASIPVTKETYAHYRRHRNDLKFIASAYAKRAALVDKDKKQIVVLNLEIKADSSVVQKVVPGALISRKLDFPEGTIVRLETGPEGSTYDSRSNTINWKIPSNQRRETEESIILHITSPTGEESYHVEKFYVP